MTYLQKYNNELKKYNIKANKEDYISYKNNYNFSHGKNAHLKNYDDFINFCVEYWEDWKK